MLFIAPVMTAFIGFTVPIGLGIYWIATSAVQIVMSLFINKHYDKIGAEELIRIASEKKKKKMAKKGINPETLVNNANISTKQIKRAGSGLSTFKDMNMAASSNNHSNSSNNKNKNNKNHKNNNSNNNPNNKGNTSAANEAETTSNAPEAKELKSDNSKKKGQQGGSLAEKASLVNNSNNNPNNKGNTSAANEAETTSNAPEAKELKSDNSKKKGQQGGSLAEKASLVNNYTNKKTKK